MWKQTLLFAIVLIFGAVVFVAAEHVFSPTFQACLGQFPPNQESIGATANNYVRCSGIFISDNSNGIAAFAALVVAIFTVFLWAATHRQALLTKEALISNNRAFVFVPTFGQFWEHDPATDHYNWRLRPTLRNSGETPTKNLTMFVECEIRNTPLPAGYSFTADARNIARAIIPPKFDISGGAAPRNPGAAITPQDIIDAQNSRKFIYLWGVIRYSDVFPGTRPHITKYCYIITTTGDPLKFVPNTPGQPPTPGNSRLPDDSSFGGELH
jgi:hypothetical protein